MCRVPKAAVDECPKSVCVCLCVASARCCACGWQFPATTCELISRLRSWRDVLLGQVQQVSHLLKLERHSVQVV
jgi:hypothetical protein